MSNDTVKETPSNLFTDTMARMNKGRTPGDLSEALMKVVQAVRATGKPGSVTYTLHIRPLKGQDTAVDLSDDVNKKLPKPDRKKRILYATTEGYLSVEDPEQEELRFNEGAAVVEGGAKPESDTNENDNVKPRKATAS